MPALEKRFKPTRIEFYQNPKDNVTPAQVRQATGCDLVINCCYFDMAASAMLKINGVKTRRPDGIFIWNDQIIRKEWNAAEGFGFDSNGGFDFGWSDQMNRHNFVYGDILIDNRALRDPTKVAEGARRPTERTSISRMPNGDLLVYCTTDIIAPAVLQSRLAAKGVQTSLMLDGSLSTQWSCEGGNHTTGRNFVPFWLCFWWGEQPKQTTPTVTAQGDFSALPVLGKGSSGVNVKVLQSVLNARGCSCGFADGVFGARTETALCNFQRKNGLPTTGKTDAATWYKLVGG